MHDTSGRLRVLRQRHGLSLREVARGMGIAPSYLSDLERGNRPWSKRLEQAFVRAVKEGK